ncbi:MAG: hypothetical protein US94_C0009G0006 [Berkelbacteria bacterium GW2011_GWB1_38_5]|uniref:Uncharacterized protein n=2 Tax=Candidatus Berkelbacteria TaxID=1618330 RepID=A0A0G0LII4_9BACT|nr:MAG: hypothetical protein US94_C0009G0006 [Berkelbacteria bacterium GW2011_GWB1_38_5]KKQ90882.1 MAG: hypothetical protein UT15_C0003G0057 [Berkelbacteria bacterium GW2011_GWA1_39_10]
MRFSFFYYIVKIVQKLKGESKLTTLDELFQERVRRLNQTVSTCPIASIERCGHDSYHKEKCSSCVALYDFLVTIGEIENIDIRANKLDEMISDFLCGTMLKAGLEKTKTIISEIGPIESLSTKQIVILEAIERLLEHLEDDSYEIDIIVKVMEATLRQQLSDLLPTIKS